MAAKKKREDAVSMAARQREIAVSEFFAKNRHLLGFDNPTKALLTTVREAVDNALDASEEAGILPDIEVTIRDLGDNKYSITIEDNGPGVMRSQLGKIFGKLLYGSKFHRLKQSRGQQGIGISAAVMYGQMTTGRPAVIISKTGKNKDANRVELQIDTKTNRPKEVAADVVKDEHWLEKVSGTSVTITLEGNYKGGRHGVAAYLRQTALANPHARIHYTNPKGERFEYPRVIAELPTEPKEIKRHPHGVELGTLIDLMQDAGRQSVSAFLQNEFSRVSAQNAKEITEGAGLKGREQAARLHRDDAEKLYKSIQQTKLMSPPTNCLSPIGEEAIVKGLYWLFVEAQKEGRADDDEHITSSNGKADAKAKAAPDGKGQADLFANGEESAEAEADVIDMDAAGEGGAEDESGVAKGVKQVKLDDEGAFASEEENFFVTAVTRPPAVYRGNPFQVEAGLFFGKGLPGDELARMYRFANRVPLQYQLSACAMTKAVISAPWRSYEVQQSKGALPLGPLVIMVHIASAWVPYTSESKEAIAHYPEILKELRLAIMECGRRLQRFLRRKRREADEEKKRTYITKYLDPIGEALQELLELDDAERQATVEDLKEILERSREHKPTAKTRPGKKKAKKASASKARAAAGA